MSPRFTLLAAPLALALAGCTGGMAGLGGSRTFACPGMPDQPLCQSVTAIYRLTDGAGPPPAAARRVVRIRSESPPAVGSGWVWSMESWQ